MDDRLGVDRVTSATEVNTYSAIDVRRFASRTAMFPSQRHNRHDCRKVSFVRDAFPARFAESRSTSRMFWTSSSIRGVEEYLTAPSWKVAQFHTTQLPTFTYIGRSLVIFQCIIYIIDTV